MVDKNSAYWIQRANSLWSIIEESNFDPAKVLELLVDSGNEIAGMDLNQEDPAESVAYAKNLVNVWHNIFLRIDFREAAHDPDNKH